MFVSTEIVAYADESSSARVFFPSYLDYFTGTAGGVNYVGQYASFEGTLWNNNGRCSSHGAIQYDTSVLQGYDWYPYILNDSIIGGPVFEMYIFNLNAVGSYEVDGELPRCRLNGDYTYETSVSTFGRAYYCLIDYGNYLNGTPDASSTGNRRFMLLSNYVAPVLNDDPISFLYTFGQNILATSDIVYELLSTDKGGYSILSLMFGSGFLIFAVWVLAKWIIPIL